LAIVKIIIERHRGRIEVDSVEGGGATFLVFLPLDVA
jgi:signal transduction histidine kinase